MRWAGIRGRTRSASCPQPAARAAIEKAEKQGQTRYKIAQESRVDYTVLVRFLDLGTSIRLQTVDRLCDYLGLELRLKPAGRK